MNPSGLEDTALCSWYIEKVSAVCDVYLSEIGHAETLGHGKARAIEKAKQHLLGHLKRVRTAYATLRHYMEIDNA